MKKTRLLAATLSLALGFALCTGVAACDDETDSDNGDTGGNNFLPDGGLGDGSGDGGDLDFDALVSEQLTAAQWAAAFDESNFQNMKYEYTLARATMSEINGTASIQNMKETVIITADGLQYAKTVIGMGDTVEMYISAADGETLFYRQNEGEWSEPNWSDSDGEYGVEFNIALLINNIMMYGSFYDSFTYSAEQKGYVIKAGSEFEALVGNAFIVLKFKDGKLATFYSEIKSGSATEGVTGIELVKITYGGQSLTLPEV